MDEQTEFLKFLKWHSNRCQEIIAKMEEKSGELTDGDAKFLSSISKTYYQKQKNEAF